MNTIDTQYYTIKNPAFDEYKDKGSRFIAYAFPFSIETELKQKLEEIKSIHPKARHLCFAYKIGFDSNNFRTFDDGEPSGSAGKPILNAILSKNLSDVLLIVVRYFGGVLLGVPGLILAYKTSAIMALDLAEKEQVFLLEQYQLKFRFEVLNDLMRMVKEFNLNILSQDYDPDCTFIISIKQTQAVEIINKLKDYRTFEILKIEL